jgi:DNA-binding NarL/FixJ family response regulator
MADEVMGILLVDDHQLVAEGISSLLQTESFVAAIGKAPKVESTHSVKDAIERINQGERYELILLDLSMPAASGFHLLKVLAERDIDTAVVVLTASESTPDMQKAYQLGAKGYVVKFEPAEILLQKIIAVTRGEHSYPEVFYQQLQLNKGKLEDTPELTRRQREVLVLIASGKSNKQISLALDVSEATVKFHISDIFRLLEVNNRTMCVKVAIDKGLISYADISAG